MDDYVIQVATSPLTVDAASWDALLNSQPGATPFMQHAYLSALYTSGSACAATGWDARFVLLSDDQGLAAATVVYVKDHSMGEYVFDWAWARAYQQHGVPYYPKGVVAVPFAPVSGTRLLARGAQSRSALAHALVGMAEQWGLSSLHLLFGIEDDFAACQSAGMQMRHTVQFHWENVQRGYQNFDAFLTSLSQDKRKKIRQERRKVQEVGVRFRHSAGAAISPEDWAFFYRCYERTYLEHGNPPYLKPAFFKRMAEDMPENWLLFVAEREGKPIASSLIGLGQQTNTVPQSAPAKVAYGRYWGALERVDCLHFEACYYQPLEWCITHGYQRFEGGAQGEHKMARALLPMKTSSAHWIGHPEFSNAIANFLERESQGIENYMDELETRNPFRQE